MQTFIFWIVQQRLYTMLILACMKNLKLKVDYQNVEKVFLFPYISLFTPHPILQSNLDSIPMYVFKYESLHL